MDGRVAAHMATRIPNARVVELPGRNTAPPLGDQEPLFAELERFLSVVPEGEPEESSEAERVLATVLFTDIVGATAAAAELGDQGWRELLTAHHDRTRRELARYRGREVDTAGDGFFATFDGPARAIRCATAIVDTVRGLGLENDLAEAQRHKEASDAAIAAHEKALAEARGRAQTLANETREKAAAGRSLS